MIVEELIEILKTMPKDYVVTFESGDGYGYGYLAYADEVKIDHKNKQIVIDE